MTDKYRTVKPRCYVKATPKSSITRKVFNGYYMNKSWVLPIKHNHSNLHIRCNSISENLVYAGLLRNFSDIRKSEKTVIDKCISNA